VVEGAQDHIGCHLSWHVGVRQTRRSQRTSKQTKADTGSDMPSTGSTSYGRPDLAAARPDRHAAVSSF
jgi:hypothetical protein